ncbi:TIGR03085 family metal-binding protein [Corynebacterium choanae]|uniref:TIGR03085 family protein n=1 Tax=Corynebacterium choanae TaxID=1862358 RepID=A0A3G6J6V0_9CORY|nr:TIGR03085 family metal-binding protein [Corynebacterium choanae]AZA13797.1 hypothetical protein CCHOA_07025 [Corynebacterium choanae]
MKRFSRRRLSLAVMDLAQHERHALAALLRDVGPDAPTCCEGWNTRDLLIHLLVRERHPLAAAGMFFTPAQGLLEARSREYEREPFATLVDSWAARESQWLPMRLADRMVNAAEHFVHHEDVRRAMPQWEPRQYSAEMEDSLAVIAERMLPLLLRKSTRPVVVVPDGRKRILCADRRGVTKRGSDVVHVFGAVGELLLLGFDRPVVGVTFDGDKSHIVASTV